MSRASGFRWVFAALMMVPGTACSDGTAPGYHAVVIELGATADPQGTYGLQTLSGIALPARFPGVFAPQDSVYGGCLALGHGSAVAITHGDTTRMALLGSANENFFHTRAGADSAAANPGYCPPYTSMVAEGSHYAIAGDSGWVYVCNKSGCDSTRLVVTGRIVTVKSAIGDEVFASH